MAVNVLSTEESLFKLVDQSAKGLDIDITAYKEKAKRQLTPEMDQLHAIDVLVRNALENIDESSTEWTYLASRIYLQELYLKASQNRGYEMSQQRSEERRVGRECRGRRGRA